jgi:hypothetical protein
MRQRCVSASPMTCSCAPPTARWQPENPLPVNEPGGDSTHTWGPDTNRVRYPVFIPPEVRIDALLRSS